MKVTWKWLNDFIDLSDLNIEKLSDKLGAQGLEVDDVDYPAEKISNVVIGYVKNIEKHPNADNL
ncbi:MAG: hypothetical protein FXF47_09355, partial [Candidatus Mcinerneyibacterium aminivorans]